MAKGMIDGVGSLDDVAVRVARAANRRRQGMAARDASDVSALLDTSCYAVMPIAELTAEAAAAEVPYPSIAACFDAVASGEVAEALVPIENALDFSDTEH
jgi:hypothetical protein